MVVGGRSKSSQVNHKEAVKAFRKAGWQAPILSGQAIGQVGSYVVLIKPGLSPLDRTANRKSFLYLHLFII